MRVSKCQALPSFRSDDVSDGWQEEPTTMAQEQASDAIQTAIDSADPYRRQGTAYLHTRDDRSPDTARTENPSGAVVVPISVATTFEQRDPGVATAKDDPNSFGAGYEYSRTGMYIRPVCHANHHIIEIRHCLF